ncbi:unnamed protein product [Brachionus calyciflorus]|uniref:Uncharacterized protein n=1 Tax=Brachionus calyciflorus TaxID=104777 RepID=A0A813WCB2_9BILA|nr:unnamed protein product [Brachionus calyciflorus]
MIDDIEKVVQECSICQRNNKEIIKYHPAQSCKVSKILTRKAIDLVFGVYETEEGFFGILVAVTAGDIARMTKVVVYAVLKCPPVVLKKIIKQIYVDYVKMLSKGSKSEDRLPNIFGGYCSTTEQTGNDLIVFKEEGVLAVGAFNC